MSVLTSTNVLAKHKIQIKRIKNCYISILYILLTSMWLVDNVLLLLWGY